MTKTLKRYLVFAGDRYYPNGGWRDFRGSYALFEDAEKALARYYEWWQIVDSKTKQIVKEGYND